MKAVRVNEWGQALQLEDIPRPTPASDEVLVRVIAASINPFDSFVHAGYMQGMLNTPLTLGSDFAGEVVEAGPAVTRVQPGDAVFGLVPMRPGTFAEYVVAKESEVARKPRSLDFIQAAGVPLAALAGYQSLIDLGQAQPGEKVLIIGAGGAVGSCAVQLAKSLGAQVTAVDVPEKAEFVRALGPDRFIDAKAERFEDAAETYDLVLDFVGGDHLQRAFAVLRDGGRYVTSLMLPEQPEEAARRGIRAEGLATQPRADELEDLARRIDAGEVKIFLNRVFPLAECQQAIAHRMQTQEPGKVVLKVA